MNNLLDLKAAIAGLNEKFGGAVPVDNPIRSVVFKQPKYVNKNKKWAKQAQVVEHNKTITYQHIDCADMRAAVILDLDKQCLDLLTAGEYKRFDFVLPGFQYQGLEMDLFSAVGKMIVEFEFKTDPVDFANDFKKIYRLGKITVNKHSYLENGKALPNLFYFVVPAEMLQVDDLPGHTGLIWATKQESGITLQIKKIAPLLHPNEFPPAIYRHIAEKCYRKYLDILSAISK